MTKPETKMKKSTARTNSSVKRALAPLPNANWKADLFQLARCCRDDAEHVVAAMLRREARYCDGGHTLSLVREAVDRLSTLTNVDLVELGASARTRVMRSPAYHKMLAESSIDDAISKLCSAADRLDHAGYASSMVRDAAGDLQRLFERVHELEPERPMQNEASPEG